MGLHVDFDTLRTSMQRVTNAAEDIHVADSKYSPEGESDLPSMEALQEQLRLMGRTAERMQEIMRMVTNSVVTAYTGLKQADEAVEEQLR